MKRKIKKTILSLFLFYFLALIQTAFLVHFKVFGFFPNFILFAVIFINIFSSSSWQKTSSAFVGGFYLDVFSLDKAGGFFGFYTLILFGLSFLLKIILEKYVRFLIFQKA